jgi:hypothetical protein
MPESEQHELSGSELGLDVEQPDNFHIIVDFGTSAPAPAATPVSDPGVPTPAGLPQPAQEIQARSQAAIEAAMETIRTMALKTETMLQSIPDGAQPRAMRVKFGIQLDFQVGAIMAKSGAGATLEVEMEWAREPDEMVQIVRALAERREA